MIRLHHCHQTRSMRVLWLLHELGVEFDVVVHPFDKSLRSPDNLARSPAGRVPALEMDGETMFESGAMIEVLCARFPDAGLGRLHGDPDWPQWLIWVHFSETLSQHVAALTQQHVAIYEDHMRSPVVMKLEAARAGKCLDAIEARLAVSGGYLLESGFSAADIAVGQAVYIAAHFARIGDRPRLADWYERLCARPGFQAALPPDGAPRLYRRDFYPAWDIAPQPN